MSSIDPPGASPTLAKPGTPLTSLSDVGAAQHDGNAAISDGDSVGKRTGAPLDDTAESVPDTAATLAQAFARRAEALMLTQQSQQEVMQARLDRMKADFNASQEERTEQLREMNALRDMALAQAKQDDEVLKKYIAMI